MASAALVDKVTLRYFDQKIESGRKAAYKVEYADGEAYFFSQVTDFRDIGGGLAEVKGDIFSAASGATLDPHAAPADWADAGEQVDHIGNFAATIKSMGKRYVLVEYQVTPRP